MNIIIAGASRGIGFEIVKQFITKGENKVVAISRNNEKLIELRDECALINSSAQVLPLPFDFETGNYQEDLIPPILDFFDTVDILVYNAGLLINKPIDELDDNAFDRIFQVNVKGAFKMVRLLKERFNNPSHVVTISSMGGFQGSSKFPGLSLYSASKGALAILTECLAEELKEKNIKCNCLALGAVQTEMLEEAFPGYLAPLQAEEMSSYIADFAKTGHRYYNGKILPVSLSTP